MMVTVLPMVIFYVVMEADGVNNHDNYVIFQNVLPSFLYFCPGT